LKGVLIFVFVSQLSYLTMESSTGKTKALTGNTWIGFQVEKRSRSRAARSLLAPVATPVGLGAT